MADTLAVLRAKPEHHRVPWATRRTLSEVTALEEKRARSTSRATQGSAASRVCGGLLPSWHLKTREQGSRRVEGATEVCS